MRSPIPHLVHPFIPKFTAVGLLQGCSLCIVPLHVPREKISTPALQDVLTGGPGKPGWPWKPCGETELSWVLPNGHGSSSQRERGWQEGAVGMGSATWGSHLIALLTSTAWEPALTPRSLQTASVSPLGSLGPPPPPHNPAPTAGPMAPGRPSKPGGPWGRESRAQIEAATMLQ